MILGILLIAAFLRGFSGGLWRSLFSLAATAAAFAGAYLLAGPATNLIERNYAVLKGMSKWWSSILGTFPGLAAPYSTGSFEEAFGTIAGSGWTAAFQGALRHNVEAVQAVAGPNPTWASVLGLALSRLVLSAAVFFVLLGVLRMLCNLVAGSLAFGMPASFSVRFFGGLLETAIAAVWLSVLCGALYPVLTAGLLFKSNEAVASSVVMPALLAMYRVLWPALMARIS
ncbi:MAG: hypothetical protein ACM3WU_06935 [Bacillota bacterium]